MSLWNFRRRRPERWITGLVVLVLCSGPVDAADPPMANRKLMAAIDQAVAAQGITPDSPGVALWIHQPNRLTIQKGYGVTNVASKVAITPRSSFELASLSKTFTATAILILSDRGKLSIDDDVRTVLPALAKFHPQQPIRIRDLLRHTSGMPDYLAFDGVPREHADFWDNDDYLRFFASPERKLKLAFPADSRHVYNNTNYLLLASIVKQVSGKPFGEFVREEIFEPAGMHHTFVYENPHSVPRASPGYDRAVGYEWNRKNSAWRATWGTPPARTEEMLIVGDGNIWSNVEDLARWDAVIR
jgi:CubicO group peptidase (beta-lactamase class C family)